MYNLNELRIFPTAARSSSFTTAALPGMSQPALSHSTRRPEARPDITLFHRAARSSPTGTGGQHHAV